ncbi:MAG: altronate dehydratase, partial [Candidatus Pelagisphaera sp.]
YGVGKDTKRCPLRRGKRNWLQVFTTDRGALYGFSMVPVVIVSSGRPRVSDGSI